MSDLTLPDQGKQDSANHLHSNAVVIANIVEVVSSVIRNIASKDVSDSLSPQALSSDVLSNIVANRIKEKTLA